MTRYLLLIPDGMADWEVDILGNRTPLEVADTPNMDFLAKNGSCGYTKTIPDSFEPGSDIANLTILGVDVSKHYTGRGPIEALARNVNGEIIFRCNLVYVENGKMKDYSGRRIDNGEAKKVIDFLNTNLEYDYVRFHLGRSYRNLLTINKDFKQNAITTPPHDIQGKKIAEYLPKNGELAELLNELMEWSASILPEISQKTNMIWPWSGGKRPDFPKFKKMYGKSSVMISEVDLLQGIGKGLGMKVVEVDGITGYIDTNYRGLAKATLREMKKSDFVLLHTEGIDEVGHEGDAEKKVEAISLYDEKILGYLLDHLDLEDTKIMLLPDHPTPVKVRTHVAEHVPFLLYGSKRDDVRVFTEKSCKKGSIGFLDGLKLMNLLFYYRSLG
jgi:2,3-bisphosphoglycerate-independent phosphoglycerate mutase